MMVMQPCIFRALGFFYKFPAGIEGSGRIESLLFHPWLPTRVLQCATKYQHVWLISKSGSRKNMAVNILLKFAWIGVIDGNNVYQRGLH